MDSESPNLRILLAEDSEANQELIQRALTKHGHDVVIARNGQEAVKMASDEAFDGILMDCDMPIMSGLEATAAIRAMDAERGSTTKIIGFTASSSDDDRQACLQAGMDEFMPKPFSIRELRELVIRWFGPQRSDT